MFTQVFTNSQANELIQAIKELGFNTGSRGNVPGTTEAMAIALQGIETNTKDISNALDDLDVTLTRIMGSLQTIQYNQSNK
jgi:hypothetical protein